MPMVRYLLFGLWVACAAIAALSSPAWADGPPSGQPNILFIVADDQGWADVGWHNREVQTPNLDALAASGVKLENHYVFPTCSPTRAALLTGRNPSRFGILGPIAGRSELAVPTETLSLADVLTSRGYTTSLVGKWHLGLRRDVGPRQFGFASTYGYFHGQIDPHTHRYKNGDKTWHRDDEFIEENGHATDLLAAEAVRRIEAARGPAPFFLFLSFSVPHTPLAEDARWLKLYEGKVAEASRARYLAAVTHMDDAIGRVVAALERTGQRPKTLIVFTSDNGGPRKSEDERNYDGRYGMQPALASNKPLRGWKGEVFEGGIRVPALASWPGVLAPRVVTAPISALDWLPTLARLAGASPDPKARWEGTDIWPQLVESAPTASRTLYWKTATTSAVRVGDWKLIALTTPKIGEAKASLFNLAEDPFETTDRAADQPNRVKQLQAALKQQQQLDPGEGN
jgi:arylsulfatase A-like enzyme